MRVLHVEVLGTEWTDSGHHSPHVEEGTILRPQPTVQTQNAAGATRSQDLHGVLTARPVCREAVAPVRRWPQEATVGEADA